MRKARFVLTGFKRLFDSRPLHAQLVVTYECNLSCRYCHEYTHGAPLVPFETLARRVDALAELGALTYDLLGGEPLLHPDIVEVVRRIKRGRRGVGFVTIISNAFKLTRELVDGLNDAGLDCMQVSVDTIDPEPGLPKSLRSVLPRLALLAERARFTVKIQTVLTEESWRRYGEFRDLLAPFDFEFGFSLLHDGRGRIAIRGAHFAELLRRHELFPGMAFFRRHAAEMLLGDFSRPWKCLGGFKYLYVSADGATQYCSQVAGGRRPVESLTLAHLRQADVHKPCEPGCALGCVRTVSHAMASPLASLRTSAEILGDFMRPRAPALRGTELGVGARPDTYSCRPARAPAPRGTELRVGREPPLG
jgi:MoaA/NifB/PqqE/SkfB family radical SAM enzyme